MKSVNRTVGWQWKLVMQDSEGSEQRQMVSQSALQLSCYSSYVWRAYLLDAALNSLHARSPWTAWCRALEGIITSCGHKLTRRRKIENAHWLKETNQQSPWILFLPCSQTSYSWSLNPKLLSVNTIESIVLTHEIFNQLNSLRKSHGRAMNL